jgi:hypothetical protein
MLCKFDGHCGGDGGCRHRGRQGERGCRAQTGSLWEH